MNPICHQWRKDDDSSCLEDESSEGEEEREKGLRTGQIKSASPNSLEGGGATGLHGQSCAFCLPQNQGNVMAHMKHLTYKHHSGAPSPLECAESRSYTPERRCKRSGT